MNKEGLQVYGFLPNSIAAKAGVKEGDIIFSFNNLPVNGVNDYIEAQNKLKPYSRVDLVILRNNSMVELSYALKKNEQLDK